MFLDKKQGQINVFIDWMIYIFIAIFPFLIYTGYLFYDTSTRFVNLILLVQIISFVLGVTIITYKRQLSIIKSPITIALGFFLVILFIAGVNGLDFSTSFWSKATRTAGLFYFVHLGLFYFFLISVLREEKKLRNFLKVFLISSGLFSIGALLTKDGLGILFTAKAWRGFTFGNSTFAAMYLYASFLLSIYYVATSEKIKKTYWRFLIPIIFLLNPYFISKDFWLGDVNIFKNPSGIIGSAQASTITVIFSVIFLLVIFFISKIKESNVRRRIIFVSVIIGIFIAIFSINSLLSSSGFINQKYISGARPLVWDLSKKAIKDSPVLGFGSDNFTRVFELYYNNTLLEQRNGGEAWFDKAHNIFIDQTVDTGYLGVSVYLVVYLIIIGSMLFVIVRSKEKSDQYLSLIILTYFIGHLMELQTAFDTTISYIPLVIMAGLASIVFNKTYYSIYQEKKSEWFFSKNISYIFAGFLIIGSLYFFFTATVPVIRVGNTNGTIRTIGSSDKRLPLYPIIFNSKIDPGAYLYRASYDLQRGISQDPKIISDPKKVVGFAKELEEYVKGYSEYIKLHPSDYRAHLDFANVYIYQRLFDIDNLEKAHQVLDDAIRLVPNAPQAYWMKSVSYLYQRKFDLAKQWAKKGYDINPGIEESKNLINYVDNSIKTFPVIDLYVFKQI